MRRLFAAALCTCLALPATARAEGQSIIVLDASGSMWGQIGGRTKIDIAREALNGVVGQLPAGTAMGLMAYGHREKGNCDDIELVVPPATGSAQAIIEAANALQFKGKTPLTESVRRAAEALRSTEEKATVILITDGIETCEADPCALGTELERTGVDFTAHVVGFGLTEEEGRQVACLAENTGGKYIQASDLDSLALALQTTVVETVEPAPEPEPEPEPAKLAENVDPVLHLVAGGPEPEDKFVSDAVFTFRAIGADGAVSDEDETIYGRSLGSLPAGRYQMLTELHAVKVTQEVEIGPETAVSQPVAVLDAGILSLKLLAEEGGEPHKDAFWEMKAGDVSDMGFAQTYRVFPAGEYGFNARLGEVETSGGVVIEAGKVTEKTVILSAAVPVLTAFYAPGVAVEGDQTFRIFEAAQAADGSRKEVTTVFGAGAAPQLPPGDYLVVASVGDASAELAVTLKAGERTEVAVVLDAGIAAFSAPNATEIRVLRAKAALDGTREHVNSVYGAEGQLTLNAGDYVAVVQSGEASGEFPFTVKAGERVEVKASVAVGMAMVNAAGANEIAIFGKAALDGTREHLHSDYGDRAEAMLPPGDYLVRAHAGYAMAEATITVKPDERSEISIAIPQGRAVINAPGAVAVEIHQVGGDHLHSDYRDTAEATLPPGDYRAVAQYDGGAQAEQPFTLADGQQLDLTVTRP